MNPVDAFTRVLDLLIVVFGIAALFAIPLRSHFMSDSATRINLLGVEVMSILMIGLSVFGLMR